MGLMPIIFTALGIFIIAAFVFLLVSYILYKLRPKQKPYLEIPAQKPKSEIKKTYHTIPVYEPPVRKSVQRQAPRPKVNYRDVSRFEVLNIQKPRYMQSAESRTFNPTMESTSRNNIYQYYSNGYYEGGFRAVSL